MRWHQGSIPEAIAESRLQKAIFLVFITGEDEHSRRMKATLEDAAVSSKLDARCVALKLEANSEAVKQFSQIYPVVVIPSAFFIGLNGLPLEVIIEQLSADDLLEKVNKVIQTHEKQQTEVPTNVSIPPNSVNAAPAASPSTSTRATLAPQNTETLSTENSPPEKSSESAEDSQENSSQAASLEDRVERAKRLAAEVRMKKLKEEEEIEKQKEIERRKMGKQMLLNKQKQQEQEVRNVAEGIAREKAEERAAREKIRQQIAQDRADRAAKFSVDKAEEERKKQEALQEKLKAEQERAAAEAARRSLFARLQFRLPDGSATNHQFGSGEPLQVVYNYVKETVRPPFSPFKLSLAFPRREFQKNDFSQTLRDLQLAPSSSILVLPERGTVVQSSGNNGLMSFLFMFVSPILVIWRWIQTFLFSGPPKPNPPASVPTNSRARKNPQDGNSKGFGRQQGNIYRMSDPNGEDDDENNTWNGNSTQQM